jgi:hypothetical protein
LGIPDRFPATLTTGLTTRNLLLVASCVLLAGCGQHDADKPAASPLAPAAPTAALLPTPAADPGPATPAPVTQSAQALPDAGPLYVCVSETAGEQRRTVIALPAPVEALCRKAPEMGPCQYEREACRRKGGKVVTADGTEITRQTEAEYDRKVMRIRMKSN